MPSHNRRFLGRLMGWPVQYLDAVHYEADRTSGVDGRQNGSKASLRSAFLDKNDEILAIISHGKMPYGQKTCMHR